MGQEPQPDERTGLAGAHRSPGDVSLERRFPVALGLYAVLAVLVWFTMGEDKIFVQGRPVELRLVPLVVIGAMVVRTVLAREAEKIRRSGDESGRTDSASSSPEAHKKG